MLKWIAASFHAPFVESAAPCASRPFEQVRFLAGWFRETLPPAPIERLAIVRLDGAMCESTTVTLRRVVLKGDIGTYIVVDDYGLPTCRQAVNDLRSEQQIVEPIVPVDWLGPCGKCGDAAEPHTSGCVSLFPDHIQFHRVAVTKRARRRSASHQRRQLDRARRLLFQSLQAPLKFDDGVP